MKKVMTKQQLVKQIAKETGLTQTAVKKVFKSLGQSIVDNARTGISTRLVGFGNFDLVHRKARGGRNPQTDERIVIPAHRALHFKPGRELKRAAYQEEK